MPNRKIMDPHRIETATRLLTSAMDFGFLPGFSTAVYRYGQPVRLACGGMRKPGDASQAVEEETIFLVASLTKPIVCAGALLLLEAGEFSLNQPVSAHIPEFAGGPKANVKLLHLFTHTSGLCDQLPASRQLRQAHAPIGDFVKAACETDLLFAPGTRVSYQSMGILLIGELVERLTGIQLREYLKERLFEPLGMKDTTLGMPAGGMKRSAWSLDAPFAPDSNDVGNDWNTEYWRDFGAPWGGLHSNVGDLSTFLSHILGEIDGPLSPALRAATVSDQVARMPGIPESEKLSSRWGLGWMLAHPMFGSLVSGSTFGNLGATGAVFWADPETRVSCVLLTNQPRLLRDSPAGHDNLPARYSNAVAAAVI